LNWGNRVTAPKGSDDRAREPVLEPTPGKASGPDPLQQRVRQQEILAELGVKALQGAAVEALFEETARLVAEGLDAEFSKVLEYRSEENRLLVRAGYGWGPGVVGVASVGADIASPAGFALRSGKPVISNHLGRETRFRTPELLAQHGIRRAMNVILQGDSRPFGVLEVDSRSSRDFEEHDLAFLQGAANLLGMAIERAQQQRSLSTALARQRVLLREMDHRVKNNLSLVASVLHLQAKESDSDELRQQLDEAANRVRTIARAHERLQQDAEVETLDIGRYIERVCGDLEETIAQCEVEARCEPGIAIATSRAVCVAMIVNELVTNAAKYACDGEPDDRIVVRLARARQNHVAISVRDFGKGMKPQPLHLGAPKGLGKRLVGMLVRQLDGELTIHSREPGTEIIVSLPVRDQPRDDSA
jgi:two-component sensor histidine kinase